MTIHSNSFHSGSVGWPSSSSFNVDELRMDTRSTLEVHQLFFDQLNNIAGRGALVLKGHWRKGINGGDESAIRESMDAALGQNKSVAVLTLILYARALQENLPTSSCCYSHTGRIQKLISLRLQGKDVLQEMPTIDLAHGGVNVVGDQNIVNIGGDHNIVNVIGHNNQVTVNGNHNQVSRNNPVGRLAFPNNVQVATHSRMSANPNNSDILGLRDNDFS